MRFQHIVWLTAFTLLVSVSAHAQQYCNAQIRSTAPTERYTDNGDGTVTDNITQLTWMRCSVGQSWSNGSCTGSATSAPWIDLLAIAEATSFAGYDDWRLPNANELNSIVESACSLPAVNEAIFPGIVAGNYLTSTTQDPRYDFSTNANRQEVFHVDLRRYANTHSDPIVRNGLGLLVRSD